MRRWILIGLLLGGVGPVLAATLAGVSLPDSITQKDQTLVRNGIALRSKMMFKVYVAGLYLPEKKTDPAAILAQETPRRMEMHFLRAVEAEKISEGWKEGLAANTPGADAALKQQFETLCGFMEDVEEKDTIVLAYSPGQGTTVEVKGKAKGTIPGKPFADALLACWIGPSPGPGEKFKQAILGS